MVSQTRMALYEWLITLSVLVYMAGTVLSVAEEWPKQGLTDTSYLSLLLWCVGSIGLVCWGHLEMMLGLVMVSLISLFLGLWAIGDKYKHTHRRR